MECRCKISSSEYYNITFIYYWISSIQSSFSAGKKFENKYQIGLGKRNVICVRDLNEAEIKTVLWTAMDLKKTNSGMSILEKKVVNILIERQTVKNLIAALSAGRHLHALTNVLYQQNLLEICGNYSDLGKSVSMCIVTYRGWLIEIYYSFRLLSTQGDLLVISPRLHSTLVKVSTTATVPIINMGSLYQKPIEAFSLLMTIYEKFKRLTGINVSIIGSPSATCHSLMCTLPRLGINMNLACAHSAVCYLCIYFPFYQIIFKVLLTLRKNEFHHSS